MIHLDESSGIIDAKEKISGQYSLAWSGLRAHHWKLILACILVLKNEKTDIGLGT